jgi:hypothetical protein
MCSTFQLENLEEGDHLNNLEVDGRATLTCSQRNIVWGLDWADSGQGPVTDSFEHDNGASGFLDELNHCHFLKKESSLWSSEHFTFILLYVDTCLRHPFNKDHFKIFKWHWIPVYPRNVHSYFVPWSSFREGQPLSSFPLLILFSKVTSP